MGFNKKITIPNGPGACPRLRSTPSRPWTPRTGAGRHETGHSVRSNAVQPGFHAIQRPIVWLSDLHWLL